MEKKNVYPHMVVRYMAAVYQFQPISILPHNPDCRWTGAELARNLCAVDPTFAPTGRLNSDALFLLQNEILLRTIADGLRRCLVLSPIESYFCEPNGTISRSKEPPSGGLRLDRPPVGLGEKYTGEKQ